MFSLNYSNSTITNTTTRLVEKIFSFDISKINFLLIATDECKRKFSKSYCNYSAFVVLIGYVLNTIVLPLILFKIMQLKTKFRNQYNLSLMWMCSILIMALIDLIEYIAIGNGKIYSTGIILIQCVFVAISIVSRISFFYLAEDFRYFYFVFKL